jgi:hypothetical protein
MHCTLLRLIVSLNSALPFWKLLVFEIQFGMSYSFLCSISSLEARIVVIDALQLLMYFVGLLMYLKKKSVSLNQTASVV